MTLVFQYGSNCAEAVINGPDRLRGDAKFVGVAQAVGFRLAFDVWSKKRDCAAADILKASDSVVWGVLYEVPDELISRDSAKASGRKSLDAIEGEGTNYQRTSIQVSGLDGLVKSALTYVVITPKAGLQTSTEYVIHILTGLRDRGVSEEYVTKVKAIASANNPNITQELAGF